MWKYSKITDLIPKKFKIAGGKTIFVDVLESLPTNEYGYFNDAESTIKLSKTLTVSGKVVKLSDEDIFRTFLHELAHAMNFYYNCECNEIVAQCFSNFMYEFITTAKDEY